MDILRDKQYVSVPREQYEKMEKIVNDKKDTILHIELFITTYGSYGSTYSKRAWVRTHVIESNGKINHDKLELEKMVEVACDNVARVRDARIENLCRKLDKIADTWWYKLFGGSEQG